MIEVKLADRSDHYCATCRNNDRNSKKHIAFYLIALAPSVSANRQILVLCSECVDEMIDKIQRVT